MQTFSALNALPEDKLIELVKRTATRIGSAHVELGKALFALDQRRPEGRTLKKFVKEKTGVDVPDHAFACGVAFRLVGTGLSFIEEEVYDKTPLRWLLQVSAIVNLLEESSLSEESAAAIREEVCGILRNAPATGFKDLLKIKQDLKPPKDPAGAAETSDAEETGAGDTAPAPVDPLSFGVFKAIGDAAIACDDAEKLTRVKEVLASIMDIVDGKLEALQPADPVALAA